MTKSVASDTLSRAGFNVDVTDSTDTFGAGRIDATRSDASVMFGPFDGGDVVTELALPGFAFCD
jgi:hypothetical protein